MATVIREWWDVLIQGVRNGLGGGTMAGFKWALRGLRRSPGFALAVVTMLGLADAHLPKSLPYPDADRLMVLWPGENWSNEMMALARRGLHSVQGIAGRGGTDMILNEGGEPEEVFVATATTNLFDVIGVRVALGADHGRLVRGELARASRIVIAGPVGGLALAALTGRLLQGVLYGVAPLDFTSLAAALSLLAGVGYLAAYLPALRAARVDPMAVMREE
jgi:hypothetical protein